MLSIYGIFNRKKVPTFDQPLTIISDKTMRSGAVCIGDLVEVVGGCPRDAGDRCDLVGGYKSIVVVYRGELYYRIVSTPEAR